VILSIIALVITGANLIWYSTLSTNASNNLYGLAVFNQVVAAILGLIGFLMFAGQQWRPLSYGGQASSLWRLSRAFTIVALVVSVGAILLTGLRFIGW